MLTLFAALLLLIVLLPLVETMSLKTKSWLILTAMRLVLGIFSVWNNFESDLCKSKGADVSYSVPADHWS